MKILFDTSVLLPALVEQLAPHEAARPWLERALAGEFRMVLSQHNLAELYSGLTIVPIQPRVTPAMAWQLVLAISQPVADVVSLSPADYVEVIKRMAELNLAGGVIYDALIARAAEKAGVNKLLTFNVEHFRRVWPEGGKRIVSP